MAVLDEELPAFHALATALMKVTGATACEMEDDVILLRIPGEVKRPATKDETTAAEEEVKRANTRASVKATLIDALTDEIMGNGGKQNSAIYDAAMTKAKDAKAQAEA